MAGSNGQMGAAKAEKYAEYYTRLVDIENELRHYRRHFKGKTVLCNCDDPYESNFFKYFVLNFNRLKLKKLIATCYDGSKIAGTQLSFFDEPAPSRSGTPYKAVVTVVRDANGDGREDLLDIAELFRIGENEISELEGDGDFRSPECLALLDEADVVVTNPPFPLFREYAKTLIDREKKFVIIGPDKGVKYKETFPYIRDGKMWVGYKSMTKDMYFHVPDERKEWLVENKKKGSGWVVVDDEVMGRAQAIWFTNLDIKKRHENIVLFREYDPSKYQSYTNFDGIDVPQVSEIPCDYEGNMGVPISFLDEYNPDQFEIIGLGEGNLAKEIGITRNHEGRTKLEVQDPEGTYRRPFARLVIRNRHPERLED